MATEDGDAEEGFGQLGTGGVGTLSLPLSNCIMSSMGNRYITI